MKFIKEGQFHAQSQSHKLLLIIQEGFSLILLEDYLMIMKLVLLDGEKRMAKNIGLLEIHGEAIGDKEVISDSLEE
jgi:hypothetical protein